MPKIRPVSDLRNHFAEITKEAQLSGCHEHGELRAESL